MRHFFFAGLLLIASSCGYHFDSGPSKTVSVSYAIGDHEGELTTALARAVSEVPGFCYVHSGGELCLQVKICGVDDEKIGFRYDRRDKSGKLRDNLVAVENRKLLRVEVTLLDSCGKCLMGPMLVESSSDYDYADQNSLRDLSLIDAGKEDVSSVSFSLGQLDTIDGAKQDAFLPAYRDLAQKIVTGILAQYECD